MAVFHVFKIVQMVQNSAKRLICHMILWKLTNDFFLNACEHEVYEA